MYGTYELIIEEDDARVSTVVPLGQAKLSIGRKPGNAILLSERNVSRHHAWLWRVGDEMGIEDLNSYTGVWLNGERISGRAALHEGDQVQIGAYRLALRRVVRELVAPIAPAPKETIIKNLREQPTTIHRPVPHRRKSRRTWIVMMMAGLGLLGGVFLVRKDPVSQAPHKPALPISAPVPRFQESGPPAAPPKAIDPKPAAKQDVLSAEAPADTLPRPRKRSVKPRQDVTREAPPAETVVSAAVPLPEQNAAMLEEAEAHYLRGEFAAAIQVVRRLTLKPGASQTRAWRLMGAAACRLGDLESVNDAYRRVDAVSRQYLQYVCQQANVTRSAGHFVLAH